VATLANAIVAIRAASAVVSLRDGRNERPMTDLAARGMDEPSGLNRQDTNTALKLQKRGKYVTYATSGQVAGCAPLHTQLTPPGRVQVTWSPQVALFAVHLITL
jgi:hypothetical protein